MGSVNGDGSSCHSENDWESLSPELFALILKRVQQNAGRDAGEARRVVALAGVCRRWRQMIQQTYSSPLAIADLGLLQFPFALRQPGPCHRLVRCLLRRRGGRFVLLQQSLGGDGAEKLSFLMSARREWSYHGSRFAISASQTSFSKSGHAYMGKLRSDFWSADFDLWEAMAGDQQKRPAVRISFSDCMQEGLRSRRAMTCELFLQGGASPSSPSPTPGRGSRAEAKVRSNPRSSAASPPTAGALETKALAIRYAGAPTSLLGCFLATAPLLSRPPAPQQAAARFLRSYSSLRRASSSFADRSSSISAELERSAAAREAGEQAAVVMESKAPRWDEQSQCWSLDFHGRASLPSHYNFQLVRSPTSASASASMEGAPQTIFLQLGKVGKGLYSVDYCHPLSAFQAFSICLSSFATKVGVGP